MNGGTIEVPHLLLSLDHEVAVIIFQKARDDQQSTAMDYVAGYALAWDMTATEIQASAKFMIIICSDLNSYCKCIVAL
ncbi:hypothetical protein ACFX13_002554 [Malus domestica]